MLRPRLLVEYPWVVVNVSCKLCPRRGRYRIARLAAAYGPEMPLDRILADVAHDCPWWRSNPRKYEARCGARFEDLDRLRPQDLPPTGSVVRQRTPSRESVAARPATPATTSRPPMLSDWTTSTLVVACDKCGRRDTYDVAGLRVSMGDVRLTDLSAALTAECPRAIAQDYSDWCAGLLVPG